MKQLQLNGPLELWKRLNYLIYEKSRNQDLYSVRESCIWSDFELEYSDIGYRREGNKLKRLTKTYLNQNEIEKFNKNRLEVLKMKKDSVLLFRFGNEEKVNTKNRIKDFCLVALTVVFIKGKLKGIEVFYRTSEITTKFMADLIFLRDIFSNLLFLESEGIPVLFYFTKVYSKHYHFLNFVRISKKLFNEDPCDKIIWGTSFVKSIKDGRKLKYKAAEKVLNLFLESEANG